MRSGEVLGGTISDAMIPIDRLRSQSPAVRPAPAIVAEGSIRLPSPRKNPPPNPKRSAALKPSRKPMFR